MLTKFEIQKIGDLDDGRPAGHVNKCISAAIRDCQQRPGVTKTRKVTLQIEIKPVPDEHGVCNEVNLDFTVNTRLPASHSKLFSMEPRHDGTLVFNDLSQDQVMQRTIDEIGADTDTAKE